MARTVRLLGVACLCVFALGVGQAQGGAVQPKKQRPADERAYRAALAMDDPQQKLDALKAVEKDFPDSRYGGRARGSIFDVLINRFPDRTHDIEAQGKQILKHEDDAVSKWREEARFAFDMTQARPQGVDLPAAEKWASDAASRYTEDASNKAITANYVKYKEPAPSAAKLHHFYAEERADVLAGLGAVYFEEGKVDKAGALAEEAFALDPEVDDVNVLRGQVAVAQHRDAEALGDFERAQLYGGLPPRLQATMLDLYAKAHGGSGAGLTAEMDARYRQLFPMPFEAEAKTAPAGGHTVLVELFTGSECAPCVAADVALDGLLDSYPRTELVALSFDQHIPGPDALANADSVARAKVYDIGSTPTFSLDGKPLQPGGGDRAEGERVYKGLVAQLDRQAARPSAVGLQLTASLDASGAVTTQAVVQAGSDKALREEIAADPAPPAPVKVDASKPDAAKVTAAKAEIPAVAPAEPKLVVNFALVEDDIRYSGGNGIRFHRMVVRALARPAGEGFAVAEDGSSNAAATFQMADVSRTLTEYLNAYEKHNDRFEHVEFASKDTTLQPKHLAVAAWVQDATTHRILQAAIVPLAAGTAAGVGD